MELEYSKKIEALFSPKEAFKPEVLLSGRVLKKNIGSGTVGEKIILAILDLLDENFTEPPKAEKIAKKVWPDKGGRAILNFSPYISRKIKKIDGSEESFKNLFLDQVGPNAYIPKAFKFTSEDGEEISLIRGKYINKMANIRTKIDGYLSIPKEYRRILLAITEEDKRKEFLMNIRPDIWEPYQESKTIKNQIEKFNQKITTKLETVKQVTDDALISSDFSKLRLFTKDLNKVSDEIKGYALLLDLMASGVTAKNKDIINLLDGSDLANIAREQVYFGDANRLMKMESKDSHKTSEAFKKVIDIAETPSIKRKANYFYHWNLYETHLMKGYDSNFSREKRIKELTISIGEIINAIENLNLEDEEELLSCYTVLSSVPDEINELLIIDNKFTEALENTRNTMEILSKINKKYKLKFKELKLLDDKWFDFRKRQIETLISLEKNDKIDDIFICFDNAIKFSQEGEKLLRNSPGLYDVFPFINELLGLLGRVTEKLKNIPEEHTQIYETVLELTIDHYEYLISKTEEEEKRKEYNKRKNFYEAHLLFHKAETEYQKRIYEWNIEPRELELLNKAKDSINAIDEYIDSDGELKENANDLKATIENSIKRSKLVTEFIEATNNRDINKFKASIKNLRKNEPDDIIWKIQDVRVLEISEKLINAFDNDEKFKDLIKNKEIRLVFLPSHVFGMISEIMKPDVEDYPFLHLSDDRGNNYIYIDEYTFIYNLNKGLKNIEKCLYFSLSKEIIRSISGDDNETKIDDETFDFLKRQFGFDRTDIEELSETLNG